MATDAQGLARAEETAARGDHVEAVTRYRDIVAAEPANAAAHAGLARSLLLLGQAEEALAACDTALRLGLAPRAEIYRVSAAVHASQGQYAQAIAALDSALVLEPDDALGYANLGGLHTNLGHVEQAESALRKATELAPTQPLAWRRLGILALRQGDYSNALQHLRTARDLDPEAEASSDFLIAQAAEGVGDAAEALAHYEKARRLDPSHSEAHYRAALLARRLGRAGLSDSAMASYQHLQQMAEGDPDALPELRTLREAVIESGGQVDHIFALARFLGRHGYEDEALNRFQAVLARRPDDYRTLNHIGNIHLRRHQTEAALTAYERAALAGPEFGPALLNAGNAAMILGRPRRARGYFERVVTLTPRVSMGWFGLAAAHLEEGRPTVADSLIDEGLLRSDPQGRTRQALLELQRKARSRLP